MTLTNRLLVFFIAALGTVLLAFSIGLYWMALDYLSHQAFERLAALDKMLAAAVELEPDGADWEPSQRSLSGPDGGFLWRIVDENGKVIDGTPVVDELFPEFGTANQEEYFGMRRLDSEGRPWLVARRTLRAAIGPMGIAAGKHPLFAITSAVPLGTMYDALNRLAGTLAGLSVAVLVLVLVGGRAICRRALAPVARMASTARAMGVADFDERLPVPPAQDELADLGQSFNGLLDRLHESFERQRRFTGDASHQLRTPLAAILGQADVALRRERPSEDYRQALESVRRQAGHLTRIVDALLFLARVDADAGPPPAERLDLVVWLPEHLRAWAKHPRAGDLKLEDVVSPAVVQVPPALLGELVNNLIDNGLKYSEPGSPVTIRLGQEPGNVTLTIEDEGCGIAAAEQAGLFRPFFRSADARRRGIPGVGLGLAVAARLAKAFGGDITATSEPGRGSRFRVTLPAV